MKFVALDQVGRHTIVVLAANEGSLVEEELSEDAWGIGESRAMESDHFDSLLGIELATARAIQDIGRKLEESALARVEPDIDYLFDQMMVSFAEAVKSFGGWLSRID